MKKLLLSTAIMGALCGPALAQDQSVFREASDALEIRATDFIGMRVYASEAALEGDAMDGLQEGWEDIGEIGDVVMDRDGMVQAVLVDIGGFLGIGERTVALSMDAIRFVSDSATAENADDFFLVVNADRAAIEGAPEYTRTVAGEMTAEQAVEETETAIENGAEATADAAGVAAEGVENAVEETGEEMVDAGDEIADEAADAGEEVAEEVDQLDMTDEQEDVAEATDEAQDAQEEANEEMAQAEDEAADEAADQAEAVAEGNAVEGTEAATDATVTADATTEGDMATEDMAAADATTDATSDMATEEMATEDMAAADAAATTDVTNAEPTSAEARSPIEREGYVLAGTEDFTAERLDGAAVYDANDERVGEVGEIILSAEGQVQMLVIDVGGFLGLGEKPVALEMASVDILRQDGGDEIRVYVSQTEEELESMDRYEAQ